MRQKMDDGEVELSDHHHALLSIPNVASTNFQESHSLDSFLDEFLRSTRTCTHTHTCNPPSGPDSSAHTHTCYHMHTTQVLGSEEEDDDLRPISKSRRRPPPSGNREAVHKYREKKKAHTAYLEEEVKKLRLLNQQLVRKLQGHTILEAEVLRLRGLLVDLRGKIDNELGVFPLKKQCNSNGGGSTGVNRCESDLPFFHPYTRPPSHACIDGNGRGKMVVSWERNCQPAFIDCRDSTNDVASAERCSPLDTVETLAPSASQAE